MVPKVLLSLLLGCFPTASIAFRSPQQQLSHRPPRIREPSSRSHQDAHVRAAPLFFQKGRDELHEQTHVSMRISEYTRELARLRVSTSAWTHQGQETSVRIAELEQELAKLQLASSEERLLASLRTEEKKIQRLVQSRPQDESNWIQVPPVRERVQNSPSSPSSNGRRLSSSSSCDKSNVLTTPFLFTSQSHPCIQVHVKNSDGTQAFPLNLLLDTACTHGVVLKPEVVLQYNLPGAGEKGSVSPYTQIQSFSLASLEDSSSSSSFGPLNAHVQRIDGLPPGLDGIVGLPFLSQFAAVDLDFKRGIVTLYRDAEDVPSAPHNGEEKIVSASDMRTLGDDLEGIVSVPVFFNGCGPVQMLLGAGCPCTLMNWKGILDLGLGRSSEEVEPVTDWGVGNGPNEMTHRLNAAGVMTMGLPPTSSFPGVPLARGSGPDALDPLEIQVGHMPLIDAHQAHGIGGILGIDALMRCGLVRLECQSPRLAIRLYN